MQNFFGSVSLMMQLNDNLEIQHLLDFDVCFTFFVQEGAEVYIA